MIEFDITLLVSMLIVYIVSSCVISPVLFHWLKRNDMGELDYHKEGFDPPDEACEALAIREPMTRYARSTAEPLRNIVSDMIGPGLAADRELTSVTS